jgi:hypothetical protein
MLLHDALYLLVGLAASQERLAGETREKRKEAVA